MLLAKSIDPRWLIPISAIKLIFEFVVATMKTYLRPVKLFDQKDTLHQNQQKIDKSYEVLYQSKVYSLEQDENSSE